jgi:predicted ester cyclase
VTGKQLVQRLVDEVINRRDWARLSELCTPELEPKLMKAFTDFQRAFPDWSQEIVELVEEGETVVARFRCTGTQQAEWQGLKPRGGQMRIDEVYFFRVTADRLSGLWGLEDTWTRMRQLAGDDAALGELGSLS